MRHLDDGDAFVVQALERLHDLFRLRGVKIAGRLIGEDQLRIGDQGARHADQLLLAAGKLIREEILLADHLETVEHVADDAVPVLLS